MNPDAEGTPEPDDKVQRRERLWDRVVAAQAAVLPATAPAWLWDAAHAGAQLAGHQRRDVWVLAGVVLAVAAVDLQGTGGAGAGRARAGGR